MYLDITYKQLSFHSTVNMIYNPYYFDIEYLRFVTLKDSICRKIVLYLS